MISGLSISGLSRVLRPLATEPTAEGASEPSYPEGSFSYSFANLNSVKVYLNQSGRIMFLAEVVGGKDGTPIKYADGSEDSESMYTIRVGKGMPPKIDVVYGEEGKVARLLDPIGDETEYRAAVTEMRNRVDLLKKAENAEGAKGNKSTLEYIDNYLRSIEQAINK